MLLSATGVVLLSAAGVPVAAAAPPRLPPLSVDARA
eukprot:gene10011-301_t